MKRLVLAALGGAATYGVWKAYADRNMPSAQGESRTIALLEHAFNPRDAGLFIAAGLAAALEAVMQ